MKTSIILPIASLLLSFTVSKAQESPLPSQLQRQISEWRMNSLPTLDAEAYWAELKELGSRVGEANAKRIEALGSSDTDSAIALIAYKASSQLENIVEIAAWYRVNEAKIDSNIRHKSADRFYESIDLPEDSRRLLRLFLLMEQNPKRR